jgi:hypothetical protein
MVIDFEVDGGKKRNFDKQKYPDAYLIGPIDSSIYTISVMRVGLHDVGLFVEFIEFSGFFFTIGLQGYK